MTDHEECTHFLVPEPGVLCDLCINGREIVLPKHEKQAKPKTKTIMKQDPSEKLVMEYLNGQRCYECRQLRTGPEQQCRCEKARILEARICEIEDFAERYPHLKVVQQAAASATRRAALRAGVRHLPSDIDGLMIGSVFGLARRVSEGRAMEWKHYRPSGDELPV